MEKLNSAQWAGRKSGLILTQVPSHQIGIVEILHAQSDDVDEFLYDLHELHCTRIDLYKIKQMRRHFQFYKQSGGWCYRVDENVEQKINKSRKRKIRKKVTVF